MIKMRQLARTTAAGLAAVTVAAACGSDAADTTTSTADNGNSTTITDTGPSETTTSVGDATTTTAASAADTTTTTTDNNNSTTTAAPPVAGVFAAFVGGTTPRPCDNDKFQSPPSPYFGPVDLEPTIRIGQIAVFCAIGFDGTEPIDVTVTGPDGSETTFSATLDGLDRDTTVDPLSGASIDGDETDGFQWVVRSSNAAGLYTFTASQGVAPTPTTTAGDTTVTTEGDGTTATTAAPSTTTTVVQQAGIVATATVEIAGSSTPMVEPFRESRGGFGGGPVRFALSGFGAGTEIPLGIYKDLTDPFAEDGKDHDFELVTELNPVTADGGGAVVATLQDDGSLAKGERYCLATDLRFIDPPNCDNFRGGWFTP